MVQQTIFSLQLYNCTWKCDLPELTIEIAVHLTDMVTAETVKRYIEEQTEI